MVEDAPILSELKRRPKNLVFSDISYGDIGRGSPSAIA